MRLRLFTLLAMLFLGTGTLSAPKSRITTPLELNNYYADVTDSLYTMGQTWGQLFNKSYTAKDFAPLVSQHKAMIAFVERKQREVMVQKDFAGSENLRLAMLDFLSYEKRLMTEGFIPFEKLKANATEEQIKTCISKLEELAKSESEELGKVQNAQMEFAEKNGFTIEE
jgi:hypothetical protein